MNQKKQYRAPKIKVVAVKAQSRLMASSGYTGGGAFKDVVEKDYFA